MYDIAKKPTFYAFDQNNTGGTWRVDDRVTYTVIIEARSAQEANNIAEDNGIYFDGCAEGVDCDCCGDRWYRAYGDGDAVPKIYDHDPAEYNETWAAPGQVYCRVYYLDGLIKEYRKPEFDSIEEK